MPAVFMGDMNMRKTIRYFAVCMMLAILLSCVLVIAETAEATETARLTCNEQHRIILDTDAGADDALALSLLVKAQNVTIEGVTVLAGNVSLEQAADNALMTLEMAGALDIPVYLGAETTYDAVERKCFSVFGEDGMGDQDLIHPTGEPQEGSAVDFMLETIRKYPNEIEILAIGPVTNIALAIEKDPETMKLAKRIWVMGTAGFGAGNATPVAEFNVYHDVAAYDVLNNSGLPVVVVGLDLCELPETWFYDEDFVALAYTGTLGEFHALSFLRLREFKREKQGIEAVDLCDVLAAMCMIWDDFILDSKTCAAYVCTENKPTLGQIIFYKQNYTYDSMPEVDGYHYQVVTKVQAEQFVPAILSMLEQTEE